METDYNKAIETFSLESGLDKNTILKNFYIEECYVEFWGNIKNVFGSHNMKFYFIEPFSNVNLSTSLYAQLESEKVKNVMDYLKDSIGQVTITDFVSSIPYIPNIQLPAKDELSEIRGKHEQYKSLYLR